MLLCTALPTTSLEDSGYTLMVCLSQSENNQERGGHINPVVVPTLFKFMERSGNCRHD